MLHARRSLKRAVAFAMVQDIVMAYQLIARNAASGKDLDAFPADDGRRAHDAPISRAATAA